MGCIDNPTLFLKLYMVNFPQQYQYQDSAYAYAHGEAIGHGLLKVNPGDFKVTEKLGFDLSGEGEHTYLYIEKVGINSEWLARQLARFAGVGAGDVGFAGLKDRQAITRQWFSIWLPGKPDPDWQQFAASLDEPVRVLEVNRHSRKLKRGGLAGNDFDILIRDANIDNSLLHARIEQINLYGVPNYFGPQRFGHNGDNISHCLAMFEKQRKFKRQQKSIYLSAARSFIFNEILSRRVQAGTWRNMLQGDIAKLDGSNSFFHVNAVDQQIEQRTLEMDIHPSAILWGKGRRQATGVAQQLENQTQQAWPLLCNGLEQFGVDIDYRNLRVAVINLVVSHYGNELSLQFFLQKGAYATSVLREIVALSPLNEPDDLNQ